MYNVRYALKLSNLSKKIHNSNALYQVFILITPNFFLAFNTNRELMKYMVNKI